MCVWAELKPRATRPEPAVLYRQAMGCPGYSQTGRVISRAVALYIYGSVLVPVEAFMATETRLCFQVPNLEVMCKKGNKENKEAMNSGTVVSYRCVK